MPHVTMAGMNLIVNSDSRQGGRKYMEDEIVIHFEKTPDGKEIQFAYFAVLDGHGGGDAARYAREHLLEEIMKQKGFDSDNDIQVMKAIKEGFESCHRGMWKIVGTWPKTVTGMASTSGTTASIAILRNNKMYVGHVGDSGIVLGIRDNQVQGGTRAHTVTVDHKPQSPKEKKRIYDDGGTIAEKAGVFRVVWNRPKFNHKGPVRRSTHIDQIPFLAVARSLGDLWSYNPSKDTFVVSPAPDVATYIIDPHRHNCIVLGSDGLWNMLSSQDSTNIVAFCEKQNESNNKNEMADNVKHAHTLVQKALDKWAFRNMRADNTSAIVVLLEPSNKPYALTRQSSTSSTSTVSLMSDNSAHSGPNSPEDLEITRLDLDVSEETIEDFSPVATGNALYASTLSKDENGRKRTEIPLVKPVALKRTPKKQVFKGKEIPKSAPAKLKCYTLHNVPPVGSRWKFNTTEYMKPTITPYHATSGLPIHVCAKPRQSSGFSTPKSFIMDGHFMGVPYELDGRLAPGRPEDCLTPECYMKERHPELKRSHSTSCTSNLRHSGEITGLEVLPRKPISIMKSVVSGESSLSRHSRSPFCKQTKKVNSPLPGTLAKSPCKINTQTNQGSPSAALVSPIWPCNMDIGSDTENNDNFTIEDTPETRQKFADLESYGSEIAIPSPEKSARKTLVKRKLSVNSASSSQTPDIKRLRQRLGTPASEPCSSKYNTRLRTKRLSPRKS